MEMQRTGNHLQILDLRRPDLDYLRRRGPGPAENDMERISAAAITRETETDNEEGMRWRIERELQIYHKTGYFRKLLQKILQELNMHSFAVDWKNGKQELPNESWKHVMNSYVRLRDGKLG